MLDMYGTELKAGDTVNVFGLVKNTILLTCDRTTYLGYEIMNGNPVAKVKDFSKTYDSQHIVYLSSGEIQGE